MTEQEIYERVEKYSKEELANEPFDKGLPKLQDFIWSLGDSIGITGTEVLRIYFEIKSQKNK